MECIKRQNENYKGTPQTRCINPNADTFKELVVLQQCEACPVKVLLKNKVPCGQQREPKLLLPVLNQQEGYPACPFRYEGKGNLMCSITSLPVDREICGRCDAETREHEATLGDKIGNYFGAVRRWVASGRPTRTPEEITTLFNDHCSGCDRYDKKTHSCKNCGCKVTTDLSPLSNKLAMATEHCPLGRF